MVSQWSFQNIHICMQIQSSINYLVLTIRVRTVREGRCVYTHTHPTCKTYINMEFSRNIFISSTYFYSFLILLGICFHEEKRVFCLFFLDKRLVKNLVNSISSYNLTFFIISSAFVYEIN